MRLKDIKLEWYAIAEHNDKLYYENVLRDELKERIAKSYRSKELKTLQDLMNNIRGYLMYHYWSKCEWELAVGGLFSKYPDEFEKIDIFYQLEPNLPRITEYINNEMKLGLKW